MTVQQLLDLLEDKDPDAEVRIMMQESWPFECAIDGVAVREDFAAAAECECVRDHVDDDHDEDGPAGAEPEFGEGCAAGDVFIVEGRQERYGDKAAWAAAAR